MPTHNTYIYILIMALVTYLVRVLPLTLIRKEIKNITVKSFLYYVPYVTLAIMTFPAILSATSSIISAARFCNSHRACVDWKKPFSGCNVKLCISIYCRTCYNIFTDTLI